MKSAIAISFVAISFVLLTLIKQGSGQCKMLVCRFRPILSAQSGLTTSHLNSNLCPYIIMALSEYVDNDVIFVKRQVTDTYPWMFQAKRQNSDLKFILAFHSYLGNDKFYAMYQSPARRKNFIQSCIRHLRDNGFDGMTVELFIGFGLNNLRHYNKELFADFMQDIQNAFTDEAKRSGKPKLLLLGDLHGLLSYLTNDFNVPKMYSYSDYVIFNAYWYGKENWKDEVPLDRRHHTRIYKLDPEDTYNLESYIKQLVSMGAIKSKTIVSVELLGAFFYRYNYPGSSFDFYLLLDYGKVCDYLKKGGEIKRVSNIHPYHIFGTYLTYFDDAFSVKERIKYIKKTGLAGFSVNDLSADDFKENCGLGKWPLMRALNEECRKP